MPSIFSTASKEEVKKLTLGTFWVTRANESGQIVSEDIAVCKLCRSPVSAKSGSTSNLFGHLRLHHPLQFSEVSNKSKVVTATVQYSPFCAAVDESIDEPQPH
ncbi:hypothetical protein TNCV_756221 [Trichonephila clavipes]|nr:hypothetical protein TNCV_756221 [Trichonephila clavipes]